MTASGSQCLSGLFDSPGVLGGGRSPMALLLFFPLCFGCAHESTHPLGPHAREVVPPRADREPGLFFAGTRTNKHGKQPGKKKTHYFRHFQGT